MIIFTPFTHTARLRLSSFCNSIPLISSSTCLLHVFHGRSRFLWPSTLKLGAFLRALSSTVPKTCPYNRTLLAVARFFTGSLNPSLFFNTSLFFLSIGFAPHIALTITHSVRLRIDTSFSLEHHVVKTINLFLSNILSTNTETKDSNLKVGPPGTVKQVKKKLEAPVKTKEKKQPIDELKVILLGKLASGPTCHIVWLNIYMLFTW